MVISRALSDASRIDGARELAGDPLEIGEDAVALLRPECIDGVFEQSAIVHCHTLDAGIRTRWRPHSPTLASRTKVALT